jgi:TRAP-type uncharacterized transport system fused permease subunit
MFLMYYAILADVTPPVALSAYASASVFGTHPLTTGIYAARVALPKYIVGFSFILSFSGTALLIMPVWKVLPWNEALILALGRLIFAIGGSWILSMATAGYAFKPLSSKEQWILGVISLGLFWPNWSLNIGTAILAALLLFAFKKTKGGEKGKG